MQELYQPIPETVSNAEFITLLERNEREAERFKDKDDTAWKIIEWHRQNNGQTYQLIYLHNVVLLFQVDYRLKASSLNFNMCSQIMSPFKKAFKHSFKLPANITDCFIFLR